MNPFHNSATSLPRQFLIKVVSASASERKILLPFEKDGIRLGCRNTTEVWMLTQMTKHMQIFGDLNSGYTIIVKKKKKNKATNLKDRVSIAEERPILTQQLQT